jgi:lantibiotic biosynthesis protein
MSRPWRPLLSGQLAARALAAAREIAGVTARGVTHAAGHPIPQETALWETSLASGLAGQCLLHAYLALHGDGDAHAETAMTQLDRATDAAALLPMTASLYFGLPGVAWAADHLAGHLFVQQDDPHRDLDGILQRSVRRPSWEGSHNLVTGLVGIGVYALERLPRPSAVRCLEAVVAKLASRAEQTPEGATFFTPASGLLAPYAAAHPLGTYYLGMAEGIAGVIAFLGSACHAGISVGVSRPLLAASISWLLARERPPDSGYRFPVFHFPGAQPIPSRLAWWVGDLGIAASLHIAARGAAEPAWETAARRVALAAARRARTRFTEPGLAIGAAGAGHLFNRLHQATGEAELAGAARLFLRRALALREPGRGIAGFRVAPRGDLEGWWDDPGLLHGATGIGLALLAAISPVEPTWDRVLLLSLPRPNAGHLRQGTLGLV